MRPEDAFGSSGSQIQAGHGLACKARQNSRCVGTRQRIDASSIMSENAILEKQSTRLQVIKLLLTCVNTCSCNFLSFAGKASKLSAMLQRSNACLSLHLDAVWSGLQPSANRWSVIPLCTRYLGAIACGRRLRLHCGQDF